MNSNTTTRRAFFLKSSLTLGAGVAGAAGADALAAPSPTPTAAIAAEREAIRRLHQAFIADVERGRAAAATPAHQAYRSNALQASDQLELSQDGLHAEATWHVDVKLGTPIDGDSTVAQMARLQGMLSDLRWESGVIEARYEKRADHWRISALRYRSG